MAVGIVLNGAPGTPGGTITYPLSLTGTGQVVGIMDTGLDTGNISTIHPAFKGDISRNFNPEDKGMVRLLQGRQWRIG